MFEPSALASCRRTIGARCLQFVVCEECMVAPLARFTETLHLKLGRDWRLADINDVRSHVRCRGHNGHASEGRNRSLMTQTGHRWE